MAAAQKTSRVLADPQPAQAETRWKLLQAATEVFAEVGYHAATTRAISQRAGVNLAAIHYHFGDKAELYREVFRVPFQSEWNAFASFDIAHASLREALLCFYSWLFPAVEEEDPMRQLFMRLHAREDAEPSGVLGDALLQAFRPNHEKMQALLCREFSLKKPDAETERLAFALIGMASVYFHNRTTIASLAPKLLSGNKANTAMAERLVDYAAALIEAERKRRGTTKRAGK